MVGFLLVERGTLSHLTSGLMVRPYNVTWSWLMIMMGTESVMAGFFTPLPETWRWRRQPQSLWQQSNPWLSLACHSIAPPVRRLLPPAGHHMTLPPGQSCLTGWGGNGSEPRSVQSHLQCRDRAENFRFSSKSSFIKSTNIVKIVTCWYFSQSTNLSMCEYRHLFGTEGQWLTNCSEDEDKDEGAGHQARVPGPLGLVHCWDPQEDEDNGLSNAGQSLHCILDCSPRLLGNVGLHIFICTNPTERHPEWEH